MDTWFGCWFSGASGRSLSLCRSPATNADDDAAGGQRMPCPCESPTRKLDRLPKPSAPGPACCACTSVLSVKAYMSCSDSMERPAMCKGNARSATESKPDAINPLASICGLLAGTTAACTRTALCSGDEAPSLHGQQLDARSAPARRAATGQRRAFARMMAVQLQKPPGSTSVGKRGKPTHPASHQPCKYP